MDWNMGFFTSLSDNMVYFLINSSFTRFSLWH